MASAASDLRPLPPLPPRRGSVGNRPPVRVVTVLAAVLIALASLGAGGAVLVASGAVKASRALHADAASAAPTYAPLPSMSFTLSDGDRLRVLRLAVTLELDPVVDAKAVEPVAPRIVGALQSRMLDVPAGDLRGPDGTRLVKDAVTIAANRELQPVRVRQVLLREMLMN